MNITGFDVDKAKPAHNETILAHEVIPEGMNPPFDSAWGYLEDNSEMEGHSHATEEVYMIFKGEGTVIVEEEEATVSAGDVVEIPPNAYHTMKCNNKGPLLWAAFWWNTGE